MALVYQEKSPADVVIYTQDPVFARKAIIITTLASDLNPGDVINKSGAAYTSADDTDCYVVLIPALAGSQVSVTVADRGNVFNPAALNVASVALRATEAALIAQGNRIADDNTTI